MSKGNDLKNKILKGGKKPAALEFIQEDSVSEETQTANNENHITANAVNQENANIKKKRTAFEFEEDFHTGLKLFATKKKMKMIDVVTQALQEYMERNK